MVSGLFESPKSCSVTTQMPLPSCHTTQVRSRFAACSVGCPLVAVAVSIVVFFAGLFFGSVACLLVVAVASIVVFFAGLLVGFASGRFIGFATARMAGFLSGRLA